MYEIDFSKTLHEGQENLKLSEEVERKVTEAKKRVDIERNKQLEELQKWDHEKQKLNEKLVQTLEKKENVEK